MMCCLVSSGNRFDSWLWLMRASYNGIMDGFQPSDAGSIPATRSVFSERLELSPLTFVAWRTFHYTKKTIRVIYRDRTDIMRFTVAPLNHLAKYHRCRRKIRTFTTGFKARWTHHYPIQQCRESRIRTCDYVIPSHGRTA